ncbi:MAG: hypothetical protein J6M42_08970, partial [Clostridia bacterium]|nr:hypothetical protein [Clostridia bacterium]
GIFSVIRYKKPSHRINYTCGFLISARKRADEKSSRRSPHVELLEMPYTRGSLFRLTKNLLVAPRTMSF